MSERDKWGRIPVKLIEVDQEFCALNWSERPCDAGISNFQIYSTLFGDDVLWFTGGTVANDIDFSPLGIPLSNSVTLNSSGNQSIIIATSELPLLPPMTEYQVFSYSFIYRNTSNSTDVRFSARFAEVDGVSTTVQIRFDSNTGATSFVDPRIISFSIAEAEEDSGWTRVEFTVDSGDVLSSGQAYYTHVELLASSSGTGTIKTALPQISQNEFVRYRPTNGEPLGESSAPCFNTLSSCQSLQDYTIKGLKDALYLDGSSNTNVYTGPFEGARAEGVYVEFYVNQQTAASADHTAQTIIDIDGLLAVSVIYDAATSSNSRIEFSIDGASTEFELAGAIGDTYRLAAFVSRSGTLSVRGVDGNAAGDPFSAIPETVTVSGLDTATTGDFYISDLLVYDYQVQPLNTGFNLKDSRQKGDLNGDALFYAKFSRPDGIDSAGGIEPAPATLPATLIDASGLDSSGGTILHPFAGETELLEPPLTLRFTERGKSSRLPETLNTIPSLINASNKPAELQVGGTNENISALGSRDELNIQWEDHPYSDIQTDPYVDQRDYDPESQGTFWGKWLARNVYKQGFPVRYVSGYELPTGGLERTHTYSYILDKVNGPSNSGKVNGKAFDILQSLRADRAVFPAASNGRLSADISDTATSFTLQPVGVGDEYPASFRCRIGGEGFDVTRSGDDLTVVQRGLYGGAESHSEDDVVQVVEQMSGQVHDVAYDIITGAIPELAGNIPKGKWDGLAEDFLPRIYSADITEPTGVEDLLSELVATAPIYFYADVRLNTVELGVIREPSSVAIPLREDQELIADSVDLKEYPKERIDEVWVYYRIRDAAGDIDSEENYSQRFILVNPEEQQRRGRRAIRRIYTRWIEAGARDTAEEIAQAYISRFQNQPIRVQFDLDARHGDIWLGDVTRLVSRQKQTVTGEKREDLNYQVIRAQESKQGHQFTYIAQSYEFFSPVDPNSVTITIQPEDTIDGTGAVEQIDLRELYDATVATEIPNITFVVAGGPLPAGGTVVGAGSGQTWSLNNPNNWPWSPDIELRVEAGGVVAGRAGFGGVGGGVGQLNGGDGLDGQDGLRVRYATNINNLGIIGGGGGGGGGGGAYTTQPLSKTIEYSGGGGGGGAGRPSQGGSAGVPEREGFGGDDGEPGQSTTGGQGGNGLFASAIIQAGDGGSGGDLGQAGQPGKDADGGTVLNNGINYSGGSGGAPGNAIDGVSFVTYINRGDIRGNEV